MSKNSDLELCLTLGNGFRAFVSCLIHSDNVGERLSSQLAKSLFQTQASTQVLEMELILGIRIDAGLFSVCFFFFLNLKT